MNLIICSLDTLRADHLSCLGNGRGLTPNLDRIASEGALFSQTYATDIPTQPSHTALFTGKFGINSGIVSHFHPAAYLPEETLWLPSLLRRNGHVTGAVDHLFAMKDWFIRGYDDYMPPPGRSRSPGSVINSIGLPWVTEHKEQDFFLFLHFWDAHIPYVPPSPYKERYSHGTAGRIDPDITAKLEGRPSYPLFKQNLYDFLDAMPNLDYIADLYDAEVAYLDFEIGRIFQHLEQEGLLEDTMVVLFGDHGENMTEHDAWFDHAGLYDSVTHVPLILWAPGRIPAIESSAMVTLADVMPTILETMGLPAADGIDGRSLFPLMRGETATHRDAVMLSEATWQAARGVRTPEWKYIRFLQTTIYGRDGVELYDLANDPHEQVNVADLHPEVVAELGDRLDHWVSAQLGGRPDPMHSVLDAGLPAVARLNDVIAGLTRPRNDVPTPIEPGPSPLAGPVPVPGAAGCASAGAGVAVPAARSRAGAGWLPGAVAAGAVVGAAKRARHLARESGAGDRQRCGRGSRGCGRFRPSRSRHRRTRHRRGAPRRHRTPRADDAFGHPGRRTGSGHTIFGDGHDATPDGSRIVTTGSAPGRRWPVRAAQPEPQQAPGRPRRGRRRAGGGRRRGARHRGQRPAALEPAVGRRRRPARARMRSSTCRRRGPSAPSRCTSARWCTPGRCWPPRTRPPSTRV